MVEPPENQNSFSVYLPFTYTTVKIGSNVLITPYIYGTIDANYKVLTTPKKYLLNKKTIAVRMDLFGKCLQKSDRKTILFGKWFP